MRRGWQLEALKTQVGQGKACLNVDPLEPGQINFLKVHSRHIWQVPKSQDGRTEKGHGEAGQGQDLQRAAGAPMPGTACSMAGSWIYSLVF